MRAYSMLSRASLLMTIAVCLAGTSAWAQDLSYSSGSDGSDGAFAIVPPFHSGLQGASMVFDPVRGQLVIFGGALSDRNEAEALGRMWVWDGVSFTELSPGVLPPARHGAVMVWDSVRSEVVLFGGRDGDVLFDDTWIWNGTTWMERSAEVRPAARWNHGGAFDAARGEFVIFGGGIGSPVTGDTWVWNGTMWEEREPANAPSLRFQHAMTYDAARARVLLFGGRTGNTFHNQTWTWDGVNWREEAPTLRPTGVVGGTLVYDPSLEEVVLFSGSREHRGDRVVDETWFWNGARWSQREVEFRPQSRFFHAAAFVPGRGVAVFGGENSDVNLNDLWLLNAGTWQQVVGSEFVFDMRGRANGIWHFTSIDVPESVTVVFHPNAANTPVVWLASQSVTIAGGLRLDGADGESGAETNRGADPGPGGFRGGIGGGPEDSVGSFAGQTGLGPGGGAPGLERLDNAGHGRYAGVYGNLLIDPLVGGSGGGGGGGVEARRGSDGGGGGGAILIACSRDLTLNGFISARGGGASTNNGDGGHGSGGAVVLVADRLLGAGQIDVRSENGGEGRVRLEGFERPLASGSLTTPIVGPPYLNRAIENQPELMITRVAGLDIPVPPLGDFVTPDVSLSSISEVEVLVTARNIPDGTAVRLRLGGLAAPVFFPSEGEPSVTLVNGQAIFRLLLPEGAGTLQAVSVF